MLQFNLVTSQLFAGYGTQKTGNTLLIESPFTKGHKLFKCIAVL